MRYLQFYAVTDIWPHLSLSTQSCFKSSWKQENQAQLGMRKEKFTYRSEELAQYDASLKSILRRLKSILYKVNKVKPKMSIKSEAESGEPFDPQVSSRQTKIVYLTWRKSPKRGKAIWRRVNWAVGKIVYLFLWLWQSRFYSFKRTYLRTVFDYHGFIVEDTSWMILTAYSPHQSMCVHCLKDPWLNFPSCFKSSNEAKPKVGKENFFPKPRNLCNMRPCSNRS